MKCINISVLIIGLHCITAGVISAAPLVNQSTANTVYPDSIFEINGSGFQTKSHAAPILWDTVDNMPAYTSLSDGDAIPVGGENPWPSPYGNSSGRDLVIFNTVDQQRNNGTAQYKATNTHSAYLDGLSWAPTNYAYVSWWFKSDRDFYDGDHSSKLLRMSDATQETYHTFSWTQLQNYVFSNPNYCANNWNAFHVVPGKWYFLEAWFDSANRTYTVRVDGVVVRTSSWASCSSFSFNELWKIGFDGGGNAPPSITWWMDDIYVDDSFSRVMIGNNSVYENCTIFEMQPSTIWRDDAINVVLNKGAFQVGDTAYLYVIDANGNVSNNGQGYQVTIGDDGGNAPADAQPTVSFTAPTTEPTYTLEVSEPSQELTLAGTASDDNSIQSVTYSTDKGQSGTATSTDGFNTWSAPITVNKNETVVTTVTVTDDAGQATSKTMTITCTFPVGWDANEQTGDATWADSGVTYCVRLLVQGDSITGSAGKVVLGFQGRSSGDYTIRNVSIAQQDTAGSEGDVIDSTWKQVTFGSAAWGSGATVGAGVEKLSDPVAIALDPGSDYYVTFKIDAPSVYLDPPAGYRELYFDSADHTGDVDWSGNGFSVAQDYHALSKIYIYSPAGLLSPPPDFKLDL